MWAKSLLRWAARRVSQGGQAGRVEKEWLTELERVPGKLTKLAHASSVLIRNASRLRPFRHNSRKARLDDRIMDMIVPSAGCGGIDATLRQEDRIRQLEQKQKGVFRRD